MHFQEIEHVCCTIECCTNGSVIFLKLIVNPKKSTAGFDNDLIIASVSFYKRKRSYEPNTVGRFHNCSREKQRKHGPTIIFHRIVIDFIKQSEVNTSEPTDNTEIQDFLSTLQPSITNFIFRAQRSR